MPPHNISTETAILGPLSRYPKAWWSSLLCFITHCKNQVTIAIATRHTKIYYMGKDGCTGISSVDAPSSAFSASAARFDTHSQQSQYLPNSSLVLLHPSLFWQQFLCDRLFLGGYNTGLLTPEREHKKRPKWPRHQCPTQWTEEFLLGLVTGVRGRGCSQGAGVTQKQLHHQQALPNMGDDSWRLQPWRAWWSLAWGWLVRVSSSSNCLLLFILPCGSSRTFQVSAWLEMWPFVHVLRLMSLSYFSGVNISICRVCYNLEEHVIQW